MKLAVIDTPNMLDAEGVPDLLGTLTGDKPDIAMLSELPFDQLDVQSSTYDMVSSLMRHDQGIRELASVRPDIAFVLTRPVSGGTRLFNTCIIILTDGTIVEIQDKQILTKEVLPSEPDHFDPGPSRHGRIVFKDWKIATLFGSEVIFPELSRAHGRAGANLIFVPRSTLGDQTIWRVSLQMAAIFSGAYVASANKTSDGFGGGSMIIAPNGKILAETDRDNPIAIVDIDLETSTSAKKDYPANQHRIPQIPKEDQW